MLLEMKDEAGGNLNDKENVFMLDNAYEDDTLEVLSATVIMMARIQRADDKVDVEPSVHEHTNHEKLKIVVNTFDDDQIDYNIIFNDLYVENNGETDEHDSNAHDQTFDIESQIYNVQKEEDSISILSKQDLDNLFGPLYEEYYAMRSSEVSNNSATNTLDKKDTHSSSSIIVEENEAPQIVTSSEEPVANEPTTQVSNDNVNESVQEDVAELDGNTFMNTFVTHEFKEVVSCSNYHDPSNMHEFHQQHHFSDRWTKNHLIEHVIGDPSKPITTRSRLHIDAEMCMTSSSSIPPRISINQLQYTLKLLKKLGIDGCYSISTQIATAKIDTDLQDYGYPYTKILMYCDSKSAIAISCNPVQYSRTKHINIRYRFIKEHVEQVPTRLVEGVAQPVAPITVEQKLARKNKHQLKFNSHKDAKSLMEAIEKCFGGNTETKKVQKTLLKQQFENFSGSNS
nr:retrotransposon protein, putative, unclassified [Tanacetum cinerariifolium]